MPLDNVWLVLGLFAEACDVSGEPDAFMSIADVEVVAEVEVGVIAAAEVEAVAGVEGNTGRVALVVSAEFALAKGDALVGETSSDGDEVDCRLGKVILIVVATGGPKWSVGSDNNNVSVALVVSCS